MAERSIAQKSDVSATLDFDGVGVVGTRDETRTITGLVVENLGKRPLGIEIEEEATKSSFAAVIQPGETKVVLTRTFVQYWNTDTPTPRWDGLNIRWMEPA